MTRLFKQNNSPYWYGRIQINGKEKWLSSGTKNKREAAITIERKASLVKGKHSVNDMFQDLMKAIDELPQPERDTTRQEYARTLLGGTNAKLEIDDAWQVWLESPIKRNPAPQTIKMYYAIWRRFLYWAKEKGIEYLHDITPGLAQNYCSNFWKSGVSANTYNKHCRFLKSVYKVLSVQGGIMNNPWTDIPSMEHTKEGRRNFTPEQLEIICRKVTGSLRYMIAIGLYTGMRLGDVVSFKWKNIEFDNDRITHIPNKTKRKGKVVRLPLHPILKALITELKQEKHSEYFFPTEYELYKKNRAQITDLFQNHLRTCGIKPTEKQKDGHRRNAIVRFGFHSLRHSFVSLCAGNRVPQVAIMDMVGHGSPVMTALYSHANDEQKASAIKALPNIEFENDD